MLVTVNTDDVDLVHNTEVLEAALGELPAGWIVDLEFFEEGTFSFAKTYDDWFIPSDDSFFTEDTVDFITTVQGNNHLKKAASSVAFRQPEINDLVEKQNDALFIVLNAHDGEPLLDGRFIKCGDFFLDTDNGLTPVSKLVVTNNLFMKGWEDEHDIMNLFNKKENKE